MKKIFLLVIVVSMVAFVAGCSQNSKKNTSASSSSAQSEAGQETAAVVADKNNDVILSEIAALYTGVTISVTDLKTQKAEEIVIPFSKEIKIGKTPLSITVVQFMPDFVIMDGGYASKTLEPNNVGAKVKITGAAPEFNGWLFVNYPEIHPYESADYKIVLVNAIKK